MKKRDKIKVIEAGQDLFRTKGYYNTGTEEILQKADYPRSSFYYHFKSKEGFASQVLDHYGNDAEKKYIEILTDENLGSPLTRLKYFTSMMIETISKNEFKAECLIQKFSIECAANNEVLCDSTNQQLKKVLNVIEDCIELGQNENEIRKDIEAYRLAEFFQAQWYGSYIFGRLQKDISPFESNMKMVFNYMEG